MTTMLKPKNSSAANKTACKRADYYNDLKLARKFYKFKLNLDRKAASSTLTRLGSYLNAFMDKFQEDGFYWYGMHSSCLLHTDTLLLTRQESENCTIVGCQMLIQKTR